MRFVAAIAVALVLSGCASTSIYEGGQKVFTTQADMVNVKFRTASGTSFSADVVNHSVPTLAGGQSASQVIGAGTSLAGVIGATVATQGTAAVVPAAIATVPGVVQPRQTNLIIQQQWIDPAAGTRVRHKAKHRHRRHRANAAPPKD